MNSSDTEMRAPAALGSGAAPRQPRNVGVTDGAFPVLLTLLAIAVLYQDTLVSMAAIWYRSQTFAHGFVIVPASAWMAWRQRGHLAGLPRCPAASGMLLLGACGVLWLLGGAAGAPVLMQYAVILMVPCAVITTLGWPLARALAFPLAYLLLAVPFGEIFLGPLIDFTAGFTVAALKLSGIPVYRDGNFFSIPSGNWSVIDACSGLRYVVASLALGAFFAHLHYRSLRRRALVVALALAVPVLANGVRAYLIVMIGHLSDMRLAAGVDHLLYGWLFFGVVCALLFWAASRWPESDRLRGPAHAPAIDASGRWPSSVASSYVAAIGCIVIAALPPAFAVQPGSSAITGKTPLLPPAGSTGGWQPVPAVPAEWRTDDSGTGGVLGSAIQSYSRSQGLARVTLQIAAYSPASRPNPPPEGAVSTESEEWHRPDWREIASRDVDAAIEGHSLVLRETVWQGQSGRTLTWTWYSHRGQQTASPLLARWRLALDRLAGGSGTGARVTVSTPIGPLAPSESARAYETNSADAEARLVLREFTMSTAAAIGKGLNDVDQH